MWTGLLSMKQLILVSLTKVFLTHKYEIDWFLLKFQNCYFKSIRKLNFEERIFWKLQGVFFCLFFIWRKTELKLCSCELTSFKTTQWIPWQLCAVNAVFYGVFLFVCCFVCSFAFPIPWPARTRTKSGYLIRLAPALIISPDNCEAFASWC